MNAYDYNNKQIMNAVIQADEDNLSSASDNSSVSSQRNISISDNMNIDIVVE